MDGDTVIRLECVARVMAFTTVINARIEAMKVVNSERARNDCAPAYGADAFFEVEKELNDFTSAQIGL